MLHAHWCKLFINCSKGFPSHPVSDYDTSYFKGNYDNSIFGMQIHYHGDKTAQTPHSWSIDFYNFE